jgi:WhiB family redox-sensing transcriptional regulator
MSNFMDGAKCSGNEEIDFFPSSAKGVGVARRFCDDCAVKQECLDYAIAEEIFHGIWGGKSENQRRILAKKLQSR